MDRRHEVVLKSWGREIIFENNDMYCGKELLVYNKIWSSNGNFHYHKIKDETFYVINGTLQLDIVEDGEIKPIILRQSDISFRYLRVLLLWNYFYRIIVLFSNPINK